MANSLSAIDLAKQDQRKYDASWITENARRAEVALAALRTAKPAACAPLPMWIARRVSKASGTAGGARGIPRHRRSAGRRLCAGFDRAALSRRADPLMQESDGARRRREVGGIPWIEASAGDALAHV